jgi:CBS domain-containing protein
MTSPVLTVAASDLASHVGRAMAREGVKPVVVTDDCRVDGIFTATDYIKLGVVASDPPSRTVDDCMIGDVVTVSPLDSVVTAADRTVEHDISHPRRRR